MGGVVVLFAAALSKRSGPGGSRKLDAGQSHRTRQCWRRGDRPGILASGPVRHRSSWRSCSRLLAACSKLMRPPCLFPFVLFQRDICPLFRGPAFDILFFFSIVWRNLFLVPLFNTPVDFNGQRVYRGTPSFFFSPSFFERKRFFIERPGSRPARSSDSCLSITRRPDRSSLRTRRVHAPASGA